MSRMDSPVDDSVWPLRTMTPPSTERRGTMWPGRVKSAGREVESESLRAVRARSCAEMPVVVPTLARQLLSHPTPMDHGTHHACSRR